MRLIIIGLLLSLNAFATEWRDLEVGQKLTLKQGFQLKQTERSGSLLEFVRGEKYTLKEIFPLTLPGAPMMIYILQYPACPGPAMKSEMEIIPVQGTSPVVEIGAILEEECELSFYVEVRDLFSESLFE